MTAIYIFWIVNVIQPKIEGEYYARKTAKDTGGSLYHVSSLNLKSNESYQYTDVAFGHDGQIISADTINGEWYTVGDTLFTDNYNVKWLIKRNSLIKLSAVHLKYRKK